MTITALLRGLVEEKSPAADVEAIIAAVPKPEFLRYAEIEIEKLNRAQATRAREINRLRDRVMVTGANALPKEEADRRRAAADALFSETVGENDTKRKQAMAVIEDQRPVYLEALGAALDPCRAEWAAQAVEGLMLFIQAQERLEISADALTEAGRARSRSLPLMQTKALLALAKKVRDEAAAGG